MRFIFCADAWNIRLPEPIYEVEVAAIAQLGASYSLFSYEALVEQEDIVRALRRVPTVDTPELAVYRGWMLTPEHYTQLYTALAKKNIFLLNTPEAYQLCHYLPDSYALIKEHTPLTTWLKVGKEVAIDEIMKILRLFGQKPVIVKDYVKSRKHEWFDACYIPSAADRAEVERVVSRFLQLQGADINEGLVFREYIEFEPLVAHPKSGMPLSKEYRLFFVDGQLVASTQYWEDGHYDDDEPPPVSLFGNIAQNIQSRFFTMDIAKQAAGKWHIVELGDGQVASLPERVHVPDFYQRVIEILGIQQPPMTKEG